jgi:NAD(P)-dependent dehydrogenase (short-subunit alcohol dehydrogenase family)
LNTRPVALITGAGRGIGRAIALELARGGYDIAGNDVVVDFEDLQTGLTEVGKHVEALHSVFYSVPGDIASLKTHPALIESVLDRFGRIDVLVNNAGIAPDPRRDILDTAPESYDRVMAVNSRGAFFLTQRIARHMIEASGKRSGVHHSIVFISSISASVSSPSRAEYCISKAALSQAARLFAHRLAEHAINVYEVRPGIIRTAMTEPVQEKYDRLIAEGLVPQGRWGNPEDVGRAVLALIRGDFGYSTGLIVDISGGMNIQRL